MTPKEKAEELVKKYLPYCVYIYDNMGFDDYDYNEDKAKECALIAVNEILKHEEYMIDKFKYQCLINGIHIITFATYWEEVKQEIEKL